jgi:multidrug efflux pump
MTSFAFIAGVVPLIIASGAGAEMRRVMGIAVFSGMLGVTFLGLVFTPLFYTLIRNLVDRRVERRGEKVVVVPADVQPIHAWLPPLAAEQEGGSHA